MSSRNKFEYDLLDLYSKIPFAGDPAQAYVTLIKRIADEYHPERFFILMLSSLEVSSDEDLLYTIYDSVSLTAGYDGHQHFLPLNEAVLKNSLLLKQLRAEKKKEINLKEDNYLRSLLIQNNSAAEIHSKLWGLSVTNDDNTPIAYVLACTKGLFSSEKWEFTRKIISVSVDKLIRIHEENNRIRIILSQHMQVATLVSNKEQEDVIQNVLDTTRKLLKVEKCALFLVDLSEKLLVPERISGEFFDARKIKDVPAYDIENYDPNIKGTGLTLWVLHRRKPFIANSYVEMERKSEGHIKGNWDDIMYRGKGGARDNFQCVYMVPLIAADKAIGVLKYENRTSDQPYFDKSDQRTIDIIAVLITNLLISQHIERNKYDTILPKLTGTLISFFGQTSFYENLLQECRSILHAEMCSLFLLDNQNNLTLKAIVGVPEETKNKLRLNHFDAYKDFRSSEGLTPWILRERKPINVKSYPDLKAFRTERNYGLWDDIIYHGQPEKEFKSLYAIPLIIGDEPFGVVKVENKNIPPHFFTKSDETLFDLMGRLIAIGVKYENEQYAGTMLRAAELGFLASGIAHEFNTYLGRISHTASNIKKVINSEENVLLKVNKILNNVNEAAAFIDNFRHIKNRNQHLHAFSVDSIFKELISLIEMRFRHNDITLKYTNHGVDKITMNPSEFQTIAINLLNNAFDSIMELAVKKERIIEVNIVEKHSNTFSMEFIDSGKGISPAEINHIFAPFYTTKSPKGMGVGLFWVQRIVNYLDGKIEVVSPNHYLGVTITVTLPKDASFVGGKNG